MVLTETVCFVFVNHFILIRQYTKNVDNFQQAKEKSYSQRIRHVIAAHLTT